MPPGEIFYRRDFSTNSLLRKPASAFRGAILGDMARGNRTRPSARTLRSLPRQTRKGSNAVSRVGTAAEAPASPAVWGEAEHLANRKRQRRPNSRKRANPWNKIALRAPYEDGYYDRLSEIYPDGGNKTRVIPRHAWMPIVDAYKSDDDAALLRALISPDIPVFPVEGGMMINACRQHKELIDQNPETVARLIAEVRKLSLSEIGKRIGPPVRTSRQRGPQFQRWISTQFPTTTDPAVLLAHDDPSPLLLDLPDGGLLEFCVRYLGHRGERGLDAVIKAGRRYIIAEAKLMTAIGGHQNAQVTSALALGDETHLVFDAIPIAIIDGDYLLDGNGGKYHERLKTSPIPVIHAHGLRDFVAHICAGGDPMRLR